MSQLDFGNTRKQHTKWKHSGDDIDGQQQAKLMHFHNNRQLSRSELGAFGGDDDSLDEVKSCSSFHSALLDGFRLSRYELADQCPQGSCTSMQLLSAEVSENEEKSQLLPVSSFQVFWHNIAYKTKLKITLSSFLLGFMQALKDSLFPQAIHKLNNRRGFYTVNGPTKSAPVGIEPKTILQDISGAFQSGELTAIIGPSGAGKTSLLNLLARRREEGYTGQLYVQGSERRVKISSIPQNDHLPEYLTVRENLMYASRLKNDDPNCDHDESIKRVSSILGLDHCLDTKTRIISGGELKRLAIAQELLSKPDILILDEPTSGLDSLTCYKTISVLKNITLASAKGLIEPIAIVLSIHQPQQEVFEIFDKIYVLANGGIAIYNGPPDACTQFIEHHAGVQRPDEDYNTASFLIDIASGEYGPEPIAALERQVKLDFSTEHEQLTGHKPVTEANQSRTGTFKKNNGGLVYGDSFQSDMKPLNKVKSEMFDHHRKLQSLYIDEKMTKGSGSMKTGGFWRKTGILSQRYWLSLLRDPKQLIARITLHLMVPFYLAILVGHEPGATNACPRFSSLISMKDMIGDDVISRRVLEEIMFEIENVSIYFHLVFTIVASNVTLTALSFTLDMQSTLKEHHNGWYSMPAYIFARLITDLPLTSILTSVTVALYYPLTSQAIGPGLSVGNRVLITAAAVVLTVLVSQIVSMIFAALYIGHVIAALFVSLAVQLPSLFLSGFMVRTKNMSRFMHALSNLSVYRLGIELGVIARYGYNACSCIPQSISGTEVKLLGVSDRLRSFTRFWMHSLEENKAATNIVVESQDNKFDSANSSSSSPQESSSNGDDIFQLFAKQISLYNTHGVEVRSCDDVKPRQLMELSIDENYLTRGFATLALLLVSALLILLLTVKLVLHFKTSL